MRYTGITGAVADRFGQNKRMKKVMKVVGGFLYRVSGLERLVSAIQTKVLNYKLRLRMIPVSYKVFISLLNVVIGASGMYVYIEAPRAVQDILGATTVTYVNTVQAQEPEKVEEKAWNISKFTAYSKGDGFTPGTVMASGKTVYIGAVACPRDMTLGTVIEVKGYGTYTCEDRKELKHDGEFDIYSVTISEAKQFGVKNLEWRVK